jgi:hypothetical protein
MLQVRYVIGVVAVIAALGLGRASDAQGIRKHSGSIVDVDDKAGTFILAEVGPWKVRDGVTLVTHRTVALTAETAFAIVRRTATTPSGLDGDFVETALDASEVYVTDYVTVDCRHEGRQLVALKITVVEVPAP